MVFAKSIRIAIVDKGDWRHGGGPPILNRIHLSMFLNEVQ
jgi:hypothetical protein